MMKGFEKYKTIKSNYLHEIPEHWKVLKVKHLVDKSTYYPVGDGDHGSIKPEMYQDEGIPYIRVQNLSWTGELDISNVVFISEEVQNSNLKSKLVPGDILIAKTGATVGKLGVIPESIPEANTTSSVGKLTVNKRLYNPKYILYVFQSKSIQDQIWMEASQKSAQPGFNIDDLIEFELYSPNISEQTQIAAFLDHQTGLIDTLIAKKEALIEKLKLQRQAIINEAVTKGLDPIAKMKDSGIEWLGEIPEEWEIVKLKYLGSCQNGVSQGAEYFGEGFPFVSYSDVYKNEVLPITVNGLAKSNSEEQDRFSVKEGDVFFTRTSETIDEIGIASVCLETIEKAVFAGFLIRFRPNQNRIHSSFSKYFFRCFVPRVFFVKEMNLVTRASLSQELLTRLPVCLPTLENQMKIAEYLDAKCLSFDKSILSVKEVIEKLKQYRQSLISEAVTGKIDVSTGSTEL